jgi:ribosomal protein S12 methylthiotransferase accessory factor
VTVAGARETLLGRAGLVRGLQSARRTPGDPRLFSVSALPASTGVYTHANAVGEANAAGLTWEEAARCAIGECLERYACLEYDPAALLLASEAELGDEAVGLARFAMWSDAQYDQPRFPFPRPHRDAPIRWVEARSLVTDARRYVPACLVFVPYAPRDRQDLQSTSMSSGQACHLDATRALLAGLYEVIERDAFVIAWLRQLQLPRVDASTDPELAALVGRHFTGTGLVPHFFDITLDLGLPTFLCVCEGRSARGPMFTVGAATRASAREAAAKALVEAGQAWFWARELLAALPDWRPAADWSNVRDFPDHVRLYAEPDMARHLAFLLDTPARRELPPRDADRPPPPDAALARAVELVAAAGHDVLAIDTTPRDVAAAGYVTVKVLVPGLATIWCDQFLPPLGSPRLRRVPEALGLPAAPGFHLVPHPFP